MANSLSTCGFSLACQPLCARLLTLLLRFVPRVAPEQPQGSCSDEDPRGRPQKPINPLLLHSSEGASLAFVQGDSQLQLLSNRRWMLPRTMLFCHKPCEQVEGRWPGTSLKPWPRMCGGILREGSSGNHAGGKAGFRGPRSCWVEDPRYVD